MQPNVADTPPSNDTPIYGIAVIEGVETGDTPRREFAPGSLTFAPTPFPFKWQPAEAEGHDGSVVVGRIDQIWRDGALIRYCGVMDSSGLNGAEAERLITGQFLRGVSICADDIEDADIELVFPDCPMPMIEPVSAPPAPGEVEPVSGIPGAPVSAPPAPGAMPMPMMAVSPMPPVTGAPALEAPPGVPMPLDDDPNQMPGDFDLMMPAPEPAKIITHAGRIRSLTLCAEPAFVEADVCLGESPYAPPMSEPVTAAAVASHGTATSNGAWDGGAAEKALPSPMPVATARAEYAWIDDAQIADGMIPKSGGRFPHHEVNADGTPGAANVKACQSGIGMLNGGRGGTTIPTSDVAGVHDHLARHLKDAGLEVPPLTASAPASGATVVTAASYTITIPEIWPESWFQEPPEMPPFGALHITAAGRVYGLLAPARVDHRAFRASGQRIQAPRNVDYSEFQNKACIVAGADGQVYRINAGNITFNCGHASPVDPRRADPNFAMQHYENSCSVAARVRVGENQYGTWVAGALLHGIDAGTVERMMACALSGDWQGGKLNAALLVPVEGFPASVQASVRVRDDALVSSSMPIHFDEPEPLPALDEIFSLIASATGRGPEARFAELAAQRFDEIARERG
jgi:hypothetical protein